VKGAKVESQAGTFLKEAEACAANLQNCPSTSQSMKTSEQINGPMQGGKTIANNTTTPADRPEPSDSPSQSPQAGELAAAAGASVHTSPAVVSGDGKTVTGTTGPVMQRDELNLARYRLNQDAADYAGGKKLLTTIPVRKPSKEWWVRTNPDRGYWFMAFVVELKESGDYYLPEPDIRIALQERGEKTLVARLLILSQNKQGDFFLWPIRVAAQDERQDNWSLSSLDAAKQAKSKWVRVVSRKSLGAYECMVRESDGEGPKWPDLTMGEILKISFRDKLIKSMDHPVVCELLGYEPKRSNPFADTMQQCFAPAGEPRTGVQ
jgi:hypothetical protein